MIPQPLPNHNAQHSRPVEPTTVKPQETNLSAAALASIAQEMLRTGCSSVQIAKLAEQAATSAGESWPIKFRITVE